ncbi:MAG: hypothetical protein K2Y21_00145 [Phycisphaerales bacterium]|nr:hypothetical protein [Phycisphaerales bacterium]
MVGGTFSTAGGLPAANIASWNGTAWAPLGTGVSSDVHAIEPIANGDLIVGGAFSTAGGISASRIARWDGASWSAIENSLNNDVTTIKATPDGSFVVGGAFFQNVSGSLLSRVAKWDGTAWIPLGSGFNDRVNSIDALPNGDLVAVGNFSQSGASVITKVARWNGAAWVAMTNGLGTGFQPPKRVRLLPSGAFVLCTEVPTGGTNRAACLFEWNGVSWVMKVGGIANTSASPYPTLQTAVSLPSGVIVVAGFFGESSQSALAWNGSTRGPLTATWFSGTVSTISVFGQETYYGGLFSIAGGLSTASIARQDGEKWTSFGSAINGTVNAILRMKNGDVVATGDFTITPTNGAPSRSIGLWRNGTWYRLGEGLEGVGYSLVELPNGDILAGGKFVRAGPKLINNLARWNGTEWFPMTGGQPDDTVYAMVNTPDGGVALGGQFVFAGAVSSRGVALWNGNTFRSAALTPGVIVRCLAVAPDGQLIAGGTFATPGASAPNIARFDGTGWGPIASGLTISNAGTLGAAVVRSIVVTPEGRIVATGNFDRTGLTPISRVAVWNFSSWESLGTGPQGPVVAIARASTGNILAGGSFARVNGFDSPPIAEWYDPRGLSFTTQPSDQTNCGGNLTLLACNTDGNGPVALQWQIEDPASVPFGWKSVADGPVTVEGRTVAQLANTANRWAPLEIRHARGPGPLRFRALLTNQCNAILSRSATLRIHAADFNCDGMYDDLDFPFFTNAYDLLACDDPAMPAGCPADLNADGVVDDQDFAEFVVAYNAVIPE